MAGPIQSSIAIAIFASDKGPGDPERAARQARRASGIFIPERTWTGLLAGGALLGLDRDRALELSGLA